MTIRDRKAKWDPQSARQRLQDIRKYGESARAMLAGLKKREFDADDVVQKAACYDIQCVSEATTHLMRLAPEIVERHPSVPWNEIRGIANRLRHEYQRIDFSIVWDSVKHGDLDALLAAIAKELDA